MESAFKIWETNRSLYLDYFENYTLAQLNKIPDGFSNNLIWNIGHVIVVQQALIYRSSELQGYVPDKLFELYKPGTKPVADTSQAEVNTLKELLISLIEKTKTDFADGRFVTFNKRMTSFGFYLESLTDAIAFNNYHEALHLGLMMNIRKFI